MTRVDASQAPYLGHEAPIYEAHHDEAPSHYEIPHEVGYFPAAATAPTDDYGNNRQEVASCPATILHLPLDCHLQASEQEHATNSGNQDQAIMLAHGMLRLSDPDDGTASEVALIGECEDLLFYVLNDDATMRMSETDFVLLLPNDCLLVRIDEDVCPPEQVLHLEAVFAARTKFHDEWQQAQEVEDQAEPTNNDAIIFPDDLPDDVVSRGIYRTGKCMSKLIVGASGVVAKRIQAHGEQKTNSITETKERKVSKTSIQIAKATRRVSEKTLQASVKVSDKISNVVGGSVGRAVAIKEDDTATKKRARNLLLASSVAMEEVAGGVSEGYELVVTTAKSQATSFVAKKYGEDAAELARHTAGSAASFGRTALTARRIINVKKIAKSAGKSMVKNAVKESLQSKR